MNTFDFTKLQQRRTSKYNFEDKTICSLLIERERERERANAWHYSLFIVVDYIFKKLQSCPQVYTFELVLFNIITTF
jgi:hypothetical protein